MFKRCRHVPLCAALVLVVAASASAQTLSQSPSQSQSAPAGTNDKGWHVAVYPVLVWVPLGIGIDVTVPPIDGGGGSGGGGGGGEIVDARFDGAFFGGFAVSQGFWRVDANGLWAGFGGDRPSNPKLKVDVDAVYFDATAGIRLYKDLYVTGGVRRYALKYDVALLDLPTFSREPGIWDPLIGVGYHRVGDTLEVHATFDGGGFGVGADVDMATTLRFDWKPIPHFGLTGGYSVLYLKGSDTRLGKTFTFKQTLHGPVAGIGLYF